LRKRTVRGGGGKGGDSDVTKKTTPIRARGNNAQTEREEQGKLVEKMTLGISNHSTKRKRQNIGPKKDWGGLLLGPRGREKLVGVCNLVVRVGHRLNGRKRRHRKTEQHVKWGVFRGW